MVLREYGGGFGVEDDASLLMGLGVLLLELTVITDEHGAANLLAPRGLGLRATIAARRSRPGAFQWSSAPRPTHPSPGPASGASTSRAASSGLGGFGSGCGSGGLAACCAGFDGIHFQTTARSKAPLTIQCTCRTVESESPRQTCRLHARAQARQPAGFAGMHGAPPCSSHRCSRVVRC